MLPNSTILESIFKYIILDWKDKLGSIKDISNESLTTTL